MFGFQRLGKPLDQTSHPAAGSTTMILVSKEDIYRNNRGQAPILLLRKGQEVAMENLPKLMQNGVRPEQFSFQYRQPEPVKQAPGIRTGDSIRERSTDHSGSDIPVADLLKKREAFKAAVSNPIMASLRTAIPAERAHKKVLILEPEQKCLKRLIDCLFVCGFNLEKIQPVRIPDHLSWSIERHHPNILMINYQLSGEKNGVALLKSLQRTPGVEHIILTIDPYPTLPMAEEVALRKFCDEKAVKILYKPVSRFALNQLLNHRSPEPFSALRPPSTH
jgi:hypothetical protein